MVNAKFVYRRSWKTNFINIKELQNSIIIMKLTKEHQDEIKNQQSQSNNKKVTAPELEKILSRLCRLPIMGYKVSII